VELFIKRKYDGEDDNGAEMLLRKFAIDYAHAAYTFADQHGIDLDELPQVLSDFQRFRIANIIGSPFHEREMARKGFDQPKED